MTQSSNQVVRAGYKLTLNEKRLLMLVISRVDPMIMPREMPVFEVTTEDWLKAYPDSKQPFIDLKRASSDLMDRKVFLKERTRKQYLQWVDSCSYYENEAKVVVRLGFTLTHYLCGFLEEFTSYNILEVNKLKSIHSIRLYENLARFKNTGWRKWTVEGFREIFTPEGEYPVFNDLRRWIIDPAVKEINAKTPLVVTYEAIRQGRKIATLLFKFKEKTEAQKATMFELLDQQKEERAAARQAKPKPKKKRAPAIVPSTGSEAAPKTTAEGSVCALTAKARALQAQGFKQREIAAELGVTQPRVSQMLKIG